METVALRLFLETTQWCEGLFPELKCYLPISESAKKPPSMRNIPPSVFSVQTYNNTSAVQKTEMGSHSWADEMKTIS